MEKIIFILKNILHTSKTCPNGKKKMFIKTSTYPQLTDRQNHIYKRFGSTQLTSNG